ncbi:MAG: NAD(P)/FAD-dependent oxidoreductase [Pirellulales bacterium]|nr:NAD(P)/FAD-dependent oxidoreductase [Pirellulales bacterium]
MADPDAVVVGSGPNGLSAAIALAQQGASVLVLERNASIGGGTRTAEATLPGFLHDVCSAVHPMGVLSPFFRRLALESHGLRWIRPTASVAHPLDDGPAVMLRRSVEDTARDLGVDASSYRRLIAPLLTQPDELLSDALAPLGMPRHPLQMLRLGWRGMRSANSLASRFQGIRARALFAGCASHSILPFNRVPSAAIGLMFLLAGHFDDWPVAAGGSQSIANALASVLTSLGGRIETNKECRSVADLPPAKVWLFDTSPRQLAEMAHAVLPAGYVRRLRRYRYGPGVFKLDWALSRSIPWRDPQCLQASTVHVGGAYEEIAASESAAWSGQHAQRPLVLVCQQSELDASRAPPGKHTGWAYCHVPAGSTLDQTEAIERQIERFAPGFRDCILARRATTSLDLERYNPNYIGGAIAGGASDIYQLFTRPVARLNPYTTPNPKIFICSASTPPGGGVHGMCGYHAAQAAIRAISS